MAQMGKRSELQLLTFTDCTRCHGQLPLLGHQILCSEIRSVRGLFREAAHACLTEDEEANMTLILYETYVEISTASSSNPLQSPAKTQSQENSFFQTNLFVYFLKSRFSEEKGSLQRDVSMWMLTGSRSCMGMSNELTDLRGPMQFVAFAFIKQQLVQQRILQTGTKQAKGKF